MSADTTRMMMMAQERVRRINSLVMRPSFTSTRTTTGNSKLTPKTRLKTVTKLT